MKNSKKGIFAFAAGILKKILVAAANLISGFGQRIRFSISLRMAMLILTITFKSLFYAFILIILFYLGFSAYVEVGKDIDLSKDIIKTDFNDTDTLNLLAENTGIPLLIYNGKNEVIFFSEPGFKEHEYKFYNILKKNGHDYYYIYYKDEIINNKPYKTAYFNDITENIYIAKNLLILFLIILIVFFIYTVIKSYSKASRLFAPVEELSQTIKKISAANLNLRIDVTDEKDELRELARTFNSMMDRIQEAYTGQEQFVSYASHELRTPISVIKGYIDMLDRWGKSDPAVLDEAIQAIKKETESMKEMVEKLLFLARSDKKTMKINRVLFNVSDLMVEIVNELKMISREHIIKAKIKKDIFIKADRGYIKQAVRIFTDNALKYTKKGEKVFLECHTEENFCVLIIKDTGPGISNYELNHIFDRFYRSKDINIREKGGHGLGLPIAKAIILGHNGKIKVKSKKGEGVSVTVFIPL